MKTGPEDNLVRVLVRVLRALRSWDQTALGRAAGHDSAKISMYESGARRPRRRTIERLTAAVGLPMPVVDTVLLPILRQLLALLPPEGAPVSLHGPTDGQQPDIAPDARLATALHETVTHALAAAAVELRRLEADAAPGLVPTAADRSEVTELWSRLQTCSASQRRWLVEQVGEYQSWALAETLAADSERAAANDPAMALDFARLATTVAERSAVNEGFKKRLRGLCLAFVANALRVNGELRRATAQFLAARRLWEEGAPADPDRLLAVWRIDDLEASLRRERGEFRTALTLLDRAAAGAPQDCLGRILVKRSSILERAGELAEAATTLQNAMPIVRESGDTRLRFAAEFILSTVLCRLGRHHEAEPALAGLRTLAATLDNQLDLLRVDWLSGRVVAGLGHADEACAVLQDVLREFADRHMGFDAALAGLELAVLHLEAGRTAEVRELAEGMAWIFAAQDIDREALAALRLFCEAARQERASAVQARAVLAALDAAGRRRSPTRHGPAGGGS